FLLVHQDIWDYVMQSPPALIDIKQNGKTIPAVAVINKTGLLFLLDRVSGKPIYGVDERPVPKSEVPLERTSPTQPFPVKPAPLSRMTMSMEDIATVTPELEAACRKLVAENNIQLGGPTCLWRTTVFACNSRGRRVAAIGAAVPSIRNWVTCS